MARFLTTLIMVPVHADSAMSAAIVHKSVFRNIGALH
jgi:hypothetical protein